MSQSEFPRHLLNQIEEVMKAIDIAADQITMLSSQARDLADLAARYVHEGKLGTGRRQEAASVIVHSQDVIDAEREAQREVERREQAIDEGRIAPATHPLRGPDILFDTGSQPVTGAVPLAKHGEFYPSPRLVLGIVNNEAGAFIRSADGNLKPMFDREREHDANGGNLMPTEEVLGRGRIVAGKIDPAALNEGSARSVGLTLEQAAVEFVRGTIAAQTQIEESPAAPPVEQEVDTGAAEVVSQQPVEAALVEAAAEEAKVIPPEVSSDADDKPPVGDRFYREKQTQVEADAALRDRQNANVREASEFTDSVLDLWSTTLLTEAQIAKRLATGKALIMTVLEQARMDQDPRVTGKRGVQPKPKEHMPLSAIARKIMERPAPIAATRAGVEIGKFDPPTKGGEKSSLISTGVCVVDIDNLKIYGKRGVWTADRKIVETVVKLNVGQMYPASVIQQRCGWRDERELRDAITPMMERLRDIGIIMTSLPTGIVIRVAD